MRSVRVTALVFLMGAGVVWAQPARPIAVQSANGDFAIRFSGELQVDVRTFPGVSPLPDTTQTLIRRARPAISGTLFKFVDFYVREDFGLGQMVLSEAYAQLNYFSRFNLRVGKFKPPVGLERLQSDDDTSFLERGLPTLLVPGRDIGVQLAGDIVRNRVSFAVGVFNGVPDNSLGDNTVFEQRDYAARILATPFQPNSGHVLSGLGVGIAATTGPVDGLALPSYKTFGQTTFFTFAAGVTSAGHRTRVAPQASYTWGPYGVLAEYTLSEEGFEKGAVRRDIALRSWQVAGSWLLTGEKKVYGTLVPIRPFNPKQHRWGAVEVALRVSDFAVDREIYGDGFASAAKSPRHSREWVGGVSWYLNRWVRISADYANTTFDGGAAVAAGGNRPSERVFTNRVQVNF